jgi:hypothetical protein
MGAHAPPRKIRQGFALAHEFRAPVCKFELFPCGYFPNQSLEATVAFLPQFLLQKMNTFVCRIF